MKLDRLSLLLAIVAATMQIVTRYHVVPATEAIFLLFLIQVTRAMSRASYIRPASPRTPTGAAMLTTIPERLRHT